MAKEKVKTRPETIYSTESKSTLFSKTSISNDENFLKSQISLFTLDERDESSAYESLTSLALIPTRRDKLRTMTETTDPFYSKKDRDLSETMNSLDSFQDLAQPVKEKKPSKSIDTNGKRSYRRQNSTSSRTSDRQLKGNPEIRRLARFMSARFQGPVERTPVVKPMPMSMKDVSIEENATNSPNFPNQNAIAFGEDDNNKDKEKSSDRMAKTSRSEFGTSERKRPRLDVV